MPADITTSHSTLSEIAVRVRRRADHVNSSFVSDAEVTQYVTESYYEFYDLLIESLGPQHFLESHVFDTVAGQFPYRLVDNESDETDGRPLNIYKVASVHVSLTGSGQDYTKIRPIHATDLLTSRPQGWSSANQVRYLLSTNVNESGHYGGKQYRIISFTPPPTGVHKVAMLYVPTPIVATSGGTDVGILHFTHWDEYVVVDAAMKILEKEESDTAHLVRRKEELRQRILWHANTMDYGSEPRVRDAYNQRPDHLRGEPWS